MAVPSETANILVTQATDNEEEKQGFVGQSLLVSAVPSGNTSRRASFLIGDENNVVPVTVSLIKIGV